MPKYEAITYWQLFPAQAGVILKSAYLIPIVLPFPRASGGDPKQIPLLRILQNFSPRKRG